MKKRLATKERLVAYTRDALRKGPADAIILLPPQNDALRQLYRKFGVHISRGIYFSTLRDVPSGRAPAELTPYVIDDKRGKTPFAYGALILRHLAGVIESNATAPPSRINRIENHSNFNSGTDNAKDAPTITPPKVAGPHLVSVAPYREGAVQSTNLNRYERNIQARRKCIKYYGCRCFICGFDFAATYGNLGAGFIHVHHLKALSEIRREYVANPIADLRPVCPNCHAMIHSGPEMLTIEALKSLINLSAKRTD